MGKFLVFYFVAYGGAHFYFFAKLTRAFPQLQKGQPVSITLLAGLFLAPLIARQLESTGPDILAESLSTIGYDWMGLLFLFVTASALFDILNLLFSRTPWQLAPRPFFLAAAAYSLVIGIYGYYEAQDIVTEHLTIKSSRVPATWGKIRVVQISDVHAGQIVREKRIKAIVQIVKAASPDILVSTGDLVDGHQKHFAGLERLFLEIRPGLGKYAIFGNHEYYVGADDSLKFMQDAGFTVLKNENFDLQQTIFITGVDDSRNRLARTANAAIEKRLLETAPQGEFRLLLKHRPVVEAGSLGKFDLQLSGHVHKGQIFPFNLLTWLNFPVRAGLTDIGHGSLLYVSRGTGVWGPPIRFLAPPEVTVIDLVADKSPKKN